MGDRANIALTEQQDSVYLYSHWLGDGVVDLARKGLRLAIQNGRGDDGQYAGRIITDVFLRAHADSPWTGAGVSGALGDGSVTVEINFDTSEVYVYADDSEGTYSFEVFANGPA